MFSIMENIYSGWQYVMNLLSLVGGNFHIVIENIPKFSGYISNLFANFPVPAWISLTFLAVLGYGIVAKFCHWG
ncbi:MAG: hypothetical protein NC177_03485 [Ruminococcus flavefaciens]|nr:hypothetical protein [Ruminococcus flavefaciens]